MKGFMKLFKKVATPQIEEKINIDELDHSLNLLRSTTLEVSEAAVNAASVLGERLKESQSRFYSTIDSVNDMIMIKDSSNKWKTVNKEAQRMFGVHYHDWVGKSNDEIILEMPHLRECLLKCSGTDERTWESRQPVRTTDTITVHGEERIFDIVKTPIFDEDGSRKELIIIGRDVTEIRNADRRMNACFSALNYASDAIAVLDSSYNIVFSNDSFNNAFQISHDNNDNIKEVLPGFTKYSTMVKCASQNKTWRGNYKGFAVNVMPVMNGSPVPVHYICTFKRNLLESVQSAS